MDFAALIQRIVYPRTDTPEEAWKAAANSGYAGAIMATNRMLFGGLWLFSPLPVGPGLAQLGIGFVYIILAKIAFRRSRVASGAILILVLLEALIEAVFAQDYRINILVITVGLLLALGGFRGANAVFGRHRQSFSQR